MKIGLLGTRGIPNRYGGFEEFAEQVSRYWADAGHEVFVYCELKPRLELFKYVRVQQVFVQSNGPLGSGQLLYDLRCTLDAIARNLDIIYHAGYATSVLGNSFLKFKLRGKLIYNMDGMEWKRSKFNFVTRSFIRLLEWMAVKSGAQLIADNKGIQNYLFDTYNVRAVLIEYGACLMEYDKFIEQDNHEIFDLVIARFEPENHMEEIINAYENSGVTLVIVANTDTDLYKKLSNRINYSKNIIFKGPVYDKGILDNLRFKCRNYIHGHSVGGTNPSLLEALACGCNILAHSNEFNRDVLEGHGRFWGSEMELKDLITSNLKRVTSIEFQRDYCEKRFDWKLIAFKHLELFENLVG